MTTAEIRSYTIVRPPQYRLPDVFFAQVADSYRLAAADNHHDPRKRIAWDSGYAEGTVSRWIRTARDKGYLEEGTPGRVTGRPAVCRACGRPL